MGLQLILCVEANKKTKTDYIYIKETIEHFCEIDQAEIKISPVYMDSKTKYEAKQKEVEKLEKIYRHRACGNRSVVIYFFDCDDYDIKHEDQVFLNKAKEFCKKNGYEFVWFCKDIERVYIGKKVNDKQKEKEAIAFKQKKLIDHVHEQNLRRQRYGNKMSNICNVLDRYLNRKNNF